MANCYLPQAISLFGFQDTTFSRFSISLLASSSLISYIPFLGFFLFSVILNSIDDLIQSHGIHHHSYINDSQPIISRNNLSVNFRLNYHTRMSHKAFQTYCVQNCFLLSLLYLSIWNYHSGQKLQHHLWFLPLLYSQCPKPISQFMASSKIYSIFNLPTHYYQWYYPSLS